MHLLIRDVDDGYPVDLHENAKNRQNARGEVVGWAVACQNNWTLINITHYLFHYGIGLIRDNKPCNIKDWHYCTGNKIFRQQLGKLFLK